MARGDENATVATADGPAIFSRRAIVRLYVGVGALALALTVIDVTGVFGWTVSSTALGLLGLIAVLPLADQIRKLKFGAFEAELAGRVENVETLVTDISDRVNTPDEPDRGEVADVVRMIARSESGSASTASAVLERVVWVDDEPAGNRLEIAELQKRFDVVPATTTGDGLRELTKSPETTIVITDAVRHEDGRVNLQAGRELIAEIRERYPYVPVYVYCGPGSIGQQGEELEVGARLVTSSWTTLARQLRTDARAAFEAATAEALRAKTGEVEAQTDGGIDFLAAVNGRRIAVEAKDWRRPPTASALEATIETLRRWLDDGVAEQALLVTPRRVLLPKQIDRLPPGVTVVTVGEIGSALGNSGG